MTHGRLNSNQYRICPYSINKDGFNTDRHFEMDFTAWSNLTAVKNHVVGKVIVGSVVNHIGFAYIRQLKTVLAHSALF